MAKAKPKKEKKKKGQFSDGAKGTRAERLAAVVQGANKEFKKPVMTSPRTDPLLVVPRVTTCLYGLDVKTNGGLPFGRVVLVYGPKGGGKTTLYLRGVAEAQKLCANCHQPGVFKRGKMELPNLKTGKIEKVETDVIVDCPCGKPKDMLVFWIDAEGIWLNEWARKMGVAVEKIILMRPTFGEQAYDIITSFVSIKDIDVFVIDSVAAMTPAVEMEAGMREQQQGVAARMNNKFIRKIVSGMNDAFQEGISLTLWMVNQYREKIGVMFGSPDTIPGGKGQSFATSLEIEMRPGAVKIDDNTGEPLFGEFRYTVKRNKIGVPGGKGEFMQCMAETDVFGVGDLMEHEEVIKAAGDMGIIVRPSNVMYEYGGESFRGVSQMVRYFGEHPAQYEEMKEIMLRSRLGISDD